MVDGLLKLVRPSRRLLRPSVEQLLAIQGKEPVLPPRPRQFEAAPEVLAE